MRLRLNKIDFVFHKENVKIAAEIQTKAAQMANKQPQQYPSLVVHRK